MRNCNRAILPEIVFVSHAVPTLTRTTGAPSLPNGRLGNNLIVTNAESAYPLPFSFALLTASHRILLYKQGTPSLGANCWLNYPSTHKLVLTQHFKMEPPLVMYHRLLLLLAVSFFTFSTVASVELAKRHNNGKCARYDLCYYHFVSKTLPISIVTNLRSAHSLVFLWPALLFLKGLESRPMPHTPSECILFGGLNSNTCRC